MASHINILLVYFNNWYNFSNAVEEERKEPPKEPEPVQMSLREYKAMQAQKRLINTVNLRKAGEGCDESQWAGMIVYKRESENESEEEVVEEDEEVHKKVS